MEFNDVDMCFAVTLQRKANLSKHQEVVTHRQINAAQNFNKNIVQLKYL